MILDITKIAKLWLSKMPGEMVRVLRAGKELREIGTWRRKGSCRTILHLLERPYSDILLRERDKFYFYVIKVV
jgi:hypothetical protein